ncbi:MAG: UTP--glucose-1-phosphate uridylyltransferase, partial [Planctomycetes bacterium]|nr:UTP--glucose-1-phosphate uridylyltransferase [Planctomycetota bacterium]
LTQGMLPAIGLDGKVLLAGPDSLALNPNGHGGSLAALADSGALAEMADQGVQYISYFQVDNPLVKCLDPLMLGLQADTGAEMSAKALPKRDPMEKLGNFCVVGGKTTIIEYSDLPEELARATTPNGRLRFRAGSIAVHVFSRSFVERLTDGGKCNLPVHRALKKVPFFDGNGNTFVPDQPNAVKLEMFVFDALPLAAKSMLLETSRLQEFSPVKNADGLNSLATCLHDQLLRAADWLEGAGIMVPRDAEGMVACVVEISPLFALDGEELARKKDKLPSQADFTPGERIYIGE